MINLTPKISAELGHIGQSGSLFQALGKPTFFSKNEYLQEAGKPVKSFFYMTSGLVKCFYIHEDKEVVLRLMTDNSAVLGYSGYITGGASSEYIQCLEPCKGIMVPIEPFEAHRTQNPKIDLMFRYVAEQHYLSLERRLMMLHHKTVKERYLFFCRTMEKKIVSDTPMHCIASYLGVTPESFSRMKRQLNK